MFDRLNTKTRYDYTELSRTVRYRKMPRGKGRGGGEGKVAVLLVL